MHRDVSFKGPNVATEGREAYRKVTTRFLQLLADVQVRASYRGVDGAMIAYDFVCLPEIGVAPTAELIVVQSGLIRRSEIFFDTRPFEAFAKARGAQRSPG